MKLREGVIYTGSMVGPVPTWFQYKLHLLLHLSFTSHLPMKMEQIDGSETSAYINQTPGNYPKENTLYSAHGKSLKSRTRLSCFLPLKIFIYLGYSLVIPFFWEFVLHHSVFAGQCTHSDGAQYPRRMEYLDCKTSKA